ncbi:hypothetical protein LXL04_030168 [Taraxacum kok-saghyz]
MLSLSNSNHAYVHDNYTCLDNHLHFDHHAKVNNMELIMKSCVLRFTEMRAYKPTKTISSCINRVVNWMISKQCIIVNSTTKTEYVTSSDVMQNHFNKLVSFILWALNLVPPISFTLTNASQSHLAAFTYERNYELRDVNMTVELADAGGEKTEPASCASIPSVDDGDGSMAVASCTDAATQPGAAAAADVVVVDLRSPYDESSDDNYRRHT